MDTLSVDTTKGWRGGRRSHLLVAAIFASVTLQACGTSHQVTATSTSTNTASTKATDSALAGLWNVRSTDLRSSWREIASSAQATLNNCPNHAAMNAGLALKAVSPTFERDQSLELRTAAFVYSNRAAAQHALPAFTSQTTQACIGESFVSALRQHHYITGPPRVGASSAIHVGQAAQTTRIQIPVTYRGRPHTFNLNTMTVLSGRVVGLLSTVTGTSTADLTKYDRSVATLLAKSLEHGQLVTP